MTYADTINAALAANDISQSELSRRLQRPPSFVNRLCRGRRQPTLATMEAIAEALGSTLRVEFVRKPSDSVAGFGSPLAEALAKSVEGGE